MRIMNGSGCLDALTAPEVARALDVFVSKTVTPLPREGNAPVRVAETSSGMLNSIGLANPGIDAFVEEKLPQIADLGVPLWVSVGGFGTSDYVDLCERLDEREEIETIELNLSCPNVDAVEATASEVVGACRAVTRKPLYAKLSPAVPDVADVARAAENAGADGLSLVNTIRGLSLDERTLEPVLGRAVGGYSGPALKPIAIAAVFSCHRAVRIPIVGMGGIQSGRDALDFVAAGAADVALGTVLFVDPAAPTRIRDELAAEIAAHGCSSVDDLRGTAHVSANRQPKVESSPL
jgi:dihydroorotate dehydrogenase (NAD+) catalytic subunit